MEEGKTQYPAGREKSPNFFFAKLGVQCMIHLLKCHQSRVALAHRGVNNKPEMFQLTRITSRKTSFLSCEHATHTYFNKVQKNNDQRIRTL